MVITTTRRSCSSSSSSGSVFVALISAVVIVCWIGLSALPFYSVKKHSHHHRQPLAQDELLLQSSQEDWSPIITAAGDNYDYYNRQLSKHLKQLKQEPSSSSQNQSQQEQQQQSSSSSSQQQQDAISIDYSKFSCDSMNDPDLMLKLQQRSEERRKEQQQQQSQLPKSQSQRQTNKKKKKSEHKKDNSNNDSDGDGGGGGQEDATAADGILQQSAKKLPTTSTLSSTQPKEELLLLDKCQFAKTCNDGDGVGFGVSLFCSSSSSSSDNDTSSSSTTTLHNTLTIVLLLTTLLLLFRLLNSTTDEFFSPGLEHFSLQLGLPPRFAGVTLLALGNGAPDVAATMNATLDSHEGYLMALGELTGTSMFVSGVILGVIVSLNDGTSTSSSGSHHNDDGGGTKEVEGGRKEENNDETKQQQQRKQPTTTTTTTTMKMGVPCQGPLLRDIAVLILVCIVSMSYLERGIVNYGFVYTLMGMYFVYVLTVLGADAYHLLYHLPRVRRSESGVSLCSSVGGGAMSIEGGLIPSDNKGGQREEDGNVGGGGEQQLVTNEQTPLVVTSADSHHHQHHHHLHHNHSLPVHTHSIRDTVIEAMSNYSCDEEQQQEEKIVIFHPHHAVHPHHENGPMFLQSVFRGGDALKRGSSTSGGGSHSARQTIRKSVSDGITSFNSWSYSDSARDKNEKDGASSSSYQVKRLSSPDRLSTVISSSPPPLNMTSRSSDEESQPSIELHNNNEETSNNSLCDASLQRPSSWEEAWRVNVQEFKEHWNDFFVDIYRNDENGALDVILLSIELPFTIIRKLTNPVPCDGYYCRPLVAVSIILSPLWLRYYFNDQFGYDLSATYIGYVFYGSALLVGMIVMRYAPGGDGPMDLYMVVPLTLYGFAIAATWLDSIADKLVELLELFGILLEIPSTIMGLTVLAFGNSLQDLIANVSLSRKGLSTMAVTACLAGPIFNLCIGLGLGFMALIKSEGKDEIHVKFPKNIKTGFYFTLANCVLIVIAGVFVGKGVLGKGYGYLACGLYVVYVVTSLYI